MTNLHCSLFAIAAVSAVSRHVFIALNQLATSTFGSPADAGSPPV
ncbi:hypothetical protein [Saccharopolyspora spinosa]|nr:hypothetical protein [Saccharopolyspora spinosa]